MAHRGHRCARFCVYREGRDQIKAEHNGAPYELLQKHWDQNASRLGHPRRCKPRRYRGRVPQLGEENVEISVPPAPDENRCQNQPGRTCVKIGHGKVKRCERRVLLQPSLLHPCWCCQCYENDDKVETYTHRKACAQSSCKPSLVPFDLGVRCPAAALLWVCRSVEDDGTATESTASFAFSARVCACNVHSVNKHEKCSIQ